MTETTVRSNPRLGRLIRHQTVPWVCTVVLLLGVLGDRLTVRSRTSSAAPYHQWVSQVAQAIPYHRGNWLGVDVPVPQGAITLLKPNVIISRRYEELGSARGVSVLLVQCKDARDLLGHFPPVCYAGQGWVLTSAEPRDWTVDGLPIQGMRYEFSSGEDTNRNEFSIDNFMVLPSGQTARDMDEVERAAQDQRRKSFGAGQVQLLFRADVSEADRAEMFQTFIRMLRPLIDQMMQPEGEIHP